MTEEILRIDFDLIRDQEKESLFLNWRRNQSYTEIRTEVIRIDPELLE